ncbi:MAG: SPOR domain-containing protein [Betaproteobacteria bacterium]|nr:SPOR domain-containing protein [Betaproteobacteria bacterium]
MKLHTGILALLMLVAGQLAAAPNLTVEGVQMPAWVEHQGVKLPLGLETPLQTGDRILTGPGARVLLRLGDGSLIKLGENAVLALDELARKRLDVREVVMASLDVVRGAFRFTTQALTRQKIERDVRVKIVTITMGIRGTDVWGKGAADRDIVCLIEGAIEVRHRDKSFTMQEPLSFYIAPRDKPAGPVARVSREQLRQWALETEITAGAGAVRRGGRWKVYAATAETQQEALAAYDKLRDAGYAAEIRPVKREGATQYRVRIANLPSEKEGRALAARLKAELAIAEPRVSMR